MTIINLMGLLGMTPIKTSCDGCGRAFNSVYFYYNNAHRSKKGDVLCDNCFKKLVAKSTVKYKQVGGD